MSSEISGGDEILKPGNFKKTEKHKKMLNSHSLVETFFFNSTRRASKLQPAKGYVREILKILGWKGPQYAIRRAQLINRPWSQH